MFEPQWTNRDMLSNHYACGLKNADPHSAQTTQSLCTHVELYRSLGLNTFPLPFGTKKPRLSWAFLEKRLATADELGTWFWNERVNVAIVCGAISGGLLVEDFEHYDDYAVFYDPPKIEAATIVVETPHGGIHVYSRTQPQVRRSIRICETHPIDLLGEGGYTVAAPSIIDHAQCDKAKCNRLGFGNYQIISQARTIQEVKDPLQAIELRCRELGWKMRSPSVSLTAGNEILGGSIKLNRAMTGKERARIVKALVRFWQPGKRHELTICLVAFLIKRGIVESETHQIVKAICQATADEEINERLSQVSYHYKTRLSLLPKLKGLSGLREILRVESEFE